MKKTLFVLFAVALGMVSQAQFQAQFKDGAVKPSKQVAKSAAWDHIGTPFTTYDFRDATHAHPISLQAWLDSGFAVVVDYSCTWCNPCWNLHQAGVLEGYYDRFGPNGTNELRVIWIEIESQNTSAQILGPAGGTTYADATCGDWTLGGTVPYPMADDASALNTCSSLYQNSVPTVFFIAPNGYYRSIYGEPDGIYYFDTAMCNAAMADLIVNYPHPGIAPLIAGVSGSGRVLAGESVTFAVNVTEITGVTDPVTSIQWTTSGATVNSSNTASFTTSWMAGGTYPLHLEVTNANGTTTRDFSINVIEWNWGDTMTYMVDDNFENSVGTGGGAISWGAMFPAQLLTGRQYLQRVDLYVANAGNYTMTIYKGGDNAPATQIYTRNLTFSAAEVGNGTWMNLYMLAPVQIDQSQNLWVTFSTSNIGYPACGSAYCGDRNGSLVGVQGQWYDIQTASSGQLSYTWMLRAVTGDAPLAIDGVNAAKISVYPNPVTDMVRVEAEGLRQVEVIDLAGRTVLTSLQHEINLSGLANGAYMLRVVTENGTSIERIVKQ